jgi:Ca2+-transporting ATPase
MWWVLGGATVFLSLVLTVPALRDIFRFAPLHPLDIAICLAAGTSSVIGFELIKLWQRSQPKPN